MNAHKAIPMHIPGVVWRGSSKERKTSFSGTQLDLVICRYLRYAGLMQAFSRISYLQSTLTVQLNTSGDCSPCPVVQWRKARIQESIDAFFWLLLSWKEMVEKIGVNGGYMTMTIPYAVPVPASFVARSCTMKMPVVV